MNTEENNYLFRVAYALDNMRRIKGHEAQLFVVFTHEQLEIFAADLRKMAEGSGTDLRKEVLRASD